MISINNKNKRTKTILFNLTYKRNSSLSNKFPPVYVFPTVTSASTQAVASVSDQFNSTVGEGPDEGAGILGLGGLVSRFTVFMCLSNTTTKDFLRRFQLNCGINTTISCYKHSYFHLLS